jgi:hypothetical protein
VPVPVESSGRGGERGTVLIVVVALIMLVSAIVLLGAGSFHITDNQDRTLKTSHRQEFLIRELAAWVQRTNALPCPADPAVDTLSHDFGFARSACNDKTAEGIVPFRTLSLSERDARDGWGRLMTYRISPVLANTGSGNRIFMRCRRYPWFDGNTPGSGPVINVYPGKARFCCPPEDGDFPATTDLRVFASAAEIALAENLKKDTTIDKIGRKVDLSFYDDINQAVNIGAQGAQAPIPPEAGNEEVFAVAIISHGQNGIGAYVANGTNARLSGIVGADEQANIDGDRDIVSHPVNATPGPNYFDDIVIWRTQLGLMGELNNASCYMPWR